MQLLLLTVYILMKLLILAVCNYNSEILILSHDHFTPGLGSYFCTTTLCAIKNTWVISVLAHCSFLRWMAFTLRHTSSTVHIQVGAKTFYGFNFSCFISVLFILFFFKLLSLSFSHAFYTVKCYGPPSMPCRRHHTNSA